MGLIADLEPGPVGVDTAPFIYLAEEHSLYQRDLVALFDLADEGKHELVTSALTVMEVLVAPYRAGRRDLAARYEEVLTTSRGIRVVDITRDHLRAAAQLRAATGVKTPDAIQLVTAIGAGCKTFVTNDRRLPAVRGLRVLQLSAYTRSR